MSGNQNLAGQIEVMNLTESSRRQQEQHQQSILEMQATQVASSIDVPTLPDQVRANLRGMGLPVRLFGENLADVRQRLRMELARRQVASTHLKGEDKVKEEEEEEEVTKYTAAPELLIQARQEIANFSLQRASQRLQREKRLRTIAQHLRKRKMTEESYIDDNELVSLDEACTKLYARLSRVALEGTQYGDSRALSSIRATRLDGQSVAITSSWTGALHLWDTNTLDSLAKQSVCHDDRIMNIDVCVRDDTCWVATASIDQTAKLWKIQRSDTIMSNENNFNENGTPIVASFENKGTFKGHSARLCRVAFHPMKRHLATTSYDYSWRLWDIETQQELLLQDGHWKECYGIGFHPDGSLCSTTDFAGVVQLWDLRTGKAIHHFLGHAQRVLNATFHSVNGFQLATAGDDGTIKIWDLRRRKEVAMLPAHSNIVTNLCFDTTGEFLVSSSFDGTAKIWSSRDWKMLNQLPGHEGKVTCAHIMENNEGIVTCGWDKTLKVWR